ncbi:MAG: ribonuclease P protein component [Flavisolibacter sp.]|jgi:ribonuclease P protein component
MSFGRAFVILQMVNRNTLGKEEKLKRQRLIDDLFADGKRLSVSPISVTYRFEKSEAPGLQVGVGASKKNFKKAVNRNRIKRLLREAYRLQKGHILDAMRQRQVSGYAFFIYTGKELPAYSVISEAMLFCLARLQQKLPS